jgi:hypothetical protein
MKHPPGSHSFFKIYRHKNEMERIRDELNIDQVNEIRNRLSKSGYIVGTQGLILPGREKRDENYPTDGTFGVYLPLGHIDQAPWGWPDKFFADLDLEIQPYADEVRKIIESV